MTKPARSSLIRLTVIAASLAAFALTSGCASFNSDPRASYKPRLWWLGAKTESMAAWPAARVPDLQPMTVDSIPDRVQDGDIYDRTENWPPIW
jgi:hypothetical protein